MPLLDRYLQAVRFFLPRRNQDDIVRELSENLLSQIEDREQSLGRPLTEDELAELLRRHGHPMVVAGKYRSSAHLIGPALFPLYLFALKMGLGVALIVTTVLAAIATVLHGDVLRHALEAFLAYPGRALMVFAWTTLGFAGLDLAQSRLKLTHRWDPRTLPRLMKHEERMSRTQALCELLAASAGAIWLMLVPRWPFLLLGSATSLLQLAPIWSIVYIPILGVTLATVAINVFTFARPAWTPLRTLARAAVHSVACVIFVVLLRVDQWVLAKPGATLTDGTSAERLADIANHVVEISLTVALFVTLIELGREIHRWNSRRGHVSSNGTLRHREP